MNPLIQAIKNKNYNQLRLLIELGHDVNMWDEYGNSLVNIAIEHRIPNQLIKFLIGKVASLHAKSLLCPSALHYAAASNNIEIAELLILKGFDVNKVEEVEPTPLHWAARNGSTAVAELLIANGANPDIKDFFDNNPLDVAIEQGNFDMVMLFIDKVTDFNENDYLFKTGGLYEFAEILISRGADVNTRDEDHRTPLFNAAKHNYLRVAELLINNGVDINTKDIYGKTAVFVAAEKGSKDVAELLVLKGAKTIDIERNTLLHFAAKSNNISLIKFFIESGIDVNARNFYEETPAFFSVVWESTGALKFLLDNGADLKAQNVYGYSLLHKACFKNSVFCAEILIEKGLDVNIKDNRGKPPIAYANGIWHKLLELLLNNGAEKI